MDRRILASLTLLVAFCVGLAGCGSEASVATQPNALEAATPCINCHGTIRSPGTDALIVEEWKASAHNVIDPSKIGSGIRGASCRDCHEPASGHPNKCNQCHSGPPPTQYEVTRNPDASDKCLKCHGLNHPTDRMLAKAPRHFGNMTASINNVSYRASYYSARYQGACRACHNPHNPSGHLAYNHRWAESAMGDPRSPARAREFKLFGTGIPADLVYTNSSPPNTNLAADIAKSTPVCVRCHTTTGYVQFVESGFLNVKPFGSREDKTKELTNCDACHTNYSFKPRRVPRVTLYLNFSGVTPGGIKINNNAVTYDDLATSNMCIPCHAGRVVGSIIKEMDRLGVDFSNVNGSPSAHHFSAASMLTGKGGYEFPGKEYQLGAGADTGHDRLGLANGRGPCLTCHMTRSQPADSHLFLAVVHGAPFPLYTSNRAWSQVYSVSNANSFPISLTVSAIASRSCAISGCHASLTAQALTADKEGYISALAVLSKWLRLVRNVPVNPQAAFDSTVNKARSPAKWDYLGGGTGPNLMGAVYNLATLEREPGAYVHRPLYVKRLVYDSLLFVASTATDPARGSLQYPLQQQTNVADAIQYLVTADAVTLETAANLPVKARISQHQADAAIQWLYGKARTDATLVKSRRPGDY